MACLACLVSRAGLVGLAGSTERANKAKQAKQATKISPQSLPACSPVSNANIPQQQKSRPLRRLDCLGLAGLSLASHCRLANADSLAVTSQNQPMALSSIEQHQETLNRQAAQHT
jgi:hypothetical protein